MSYRITSAAILLAVLAGCSRWNGAVAPVGSAVIREHVVSAQGNDPPIYSVLDFTIVEVDGKVAVRETIPRLVDMQPGVLVPAGNHEFKALVSPHMRPPNHRPSEVVFSATVESTKVYYLTDKDGSAVLIEAKPRQR